MHRTWQAVAAVAWGHVVVVDVVVIGALPV